MMLKILCIKCLANFKIRPNRSVPMFLFLLDTFTLQANGIKK